MNCVKYNLHPTGKKGNWMMRDLMILILVVMTSVLCVSPGATASAAPLTAIRVAPKPVDHTPDRRTHPQPTVPSTYQEVPFVETAVEPALTLEETQRGYVLFHRPITEPVYPNSRPLAHERVAQLTAFATPGEYEPLTFAIYPVRQLQNLKVRCSAMTGDAG